MNTADMLLLSWVRQACRDGRARRIRRNAELSQPEMGRTTGVSHAAISRWERGLREPRGEAALRYARLLARLEKVEQVAR